MSGLPRAAADERLPRTACLRLRPEFDRCYREGRRLHAGGFTLHWCSGGSGAARVGITASRKVGGSVRRHQLKRWTREAFRRTAVRGELGGCDVLVHFKPGGAPETFGEMRSDLERLLTEVVRRNRRA